MATQLMPSIGTILLAVTPQGSQNTFQNRSHWALETCVDAFNERKMLLIFEREDTAHICKI